MWRLCQHHCENILHKFWKLHMCTTVLDFDPHILNINFKCMGIFCFVFIVHCVYNIVRYLISLDLRCLYTKNTWWQVVTAHWTAQWLDHNCLWQATMAQIKSTFNGGNTRCIFNKSIHFLAFMWYGWRTAIQVPLSTPHGQIQFFTWT